MTRRQGVKRVPNKAANNSCNSRESMSTSDDKEINLESKPPRKKVRWNRDVNVDDSGVEISHDLGDSESSDMEESERPSKVST